MSTATLPSPFRSPEAGAILDSARRLSTRSIAALTRAARAGSAAVSSYWNAESDADPRLRAVEVGGDAESEPRGLGRRLVDVLVLETAAVVASIAFLLAIAEAGQLGGVVFLAYVACLAALLFLGFVLLDGVAREAERDVPTAALATATGGRRRRVVRARMRWLRGLLRRPNGPARYTRPILGLGRSWVSRISVFGRPAL